MSRLIVTPKMLRACEYKARVSPDIWALENYILESESAVGGGKFTFEFAPHLKKPLQCLGDDTISDVSLFFASQAGKTTIGLVALNWYMDNITGNAMFFIPDDQLVGFTATDRILPSINRTINRDSVLAEKEERALRDNTRNIRYTGGTIRILSSTKSTNRKSTPAKFIILDEVSEMQHAHVAEIMERKKTYEMFGGKCLRTSTIMAKGDPIEIAYSTSEVKYQYAVKCPYCGKSHIDNFLKQISYPPIETYEIDENLDEAEKTIIYANKASREAKYICPHCKAKWNTQDKHTAIKSGDWELVSETDSGRSVGFKASSFISCFVSIEEMTRQFLLADTDEKKTAFYRGWLSEIYEPEIKTIPTDTLQVLRGVFKAGILPLDTIGTFCAIDVQKTHYYYSVVAVNSKMDKYVIDYGRIDSEGALMDFILTAKYADEFGNTQFVRAFAIDSGAFTNDVYKLCFDLTHYFDDLEIPSRRELLEFRQGEVITIYPVKGGGANSSSMTEYGRISVIEKNINNEKFTDGLMLHIVNTYLMKDFIFANINRVVESLNGDKLYIPIDARDDILKSIVSEHKVETTQKSGRVVYAYVPLTRHPFNHYLDTLVYNFYLIERFDMRYYAMSKNRTQPQQQQQTQYKQQPRQRDYLDEF